MFCTNCGEKFKSNSKFCGKCGKQKVSSDNTSYSTSNVDFSKVEVNNSNGSIAYNNTNQYSVAKSNYLEIFKTFFMGMLFVTLGAFFGINFLPYSVVAMVNILFVVFVFASAFLLKQNIVKNKVSMSIYCFILGIIFGLTFYYYLGLLGTDIFISCVGGVGLIFGVSYWYALKSDEEDIFKMGPVLFKALIGLLIFEVLNIFFFSFGVADLLLSVAGIAIYSGYVLYSMKAIQVRCSQGMLHEEEVVGIALSLVACFLNLLLDLLRLIAIIKGND